MLDELKHNRVVCGAATAQALGLTPMHMLDRFSASAALEVLRPLMRPGQRILIPRAAEGRDELTDGLLALGVSVHSPIAYRTVAVEPSALCKAMALNRDLNAITACSPSAINSLLAAVNREWPSKTKLVCLGETTAEAARGAGLRVDGVAERTTMASLVDAVVGALEMPRVPV